MTINHAFQEAMDWATDMSWHTCGALLILGVGYLIARAFRRLAHGFTKNGEGRRRFLIPLYVFLSVMALTVILALAALGVAGTAIGIIVSVGVAMGALGDSYYGLKTFGGTQVQIGDVIELGDEGLEGWVSQMTLTTTTLSMEDGRSIIVPNRRLMDRALISRNFSRDTMLRFDLTLDPLANLQSIEQDLESLAMSVVAPYDDSNFNIFLVKIERSAGSFLIEFQVPNQQSGTVASNFLKVAKKHFEELGAVIVNLSTRPPK